jgi:hypothetical protein
MTRRVCSICANPGHETIDAQLQAGVFQKTIAASCGVSPYALSRHRRNCPNPPAPSDTSTSVESQITLWRERANLCWEQSLADQDIRGQVQACQTGLRALEIARRQEQREVEVTAQAADDGPIDVALLDRWTQKLIAALERLQNVDENVIRVAVGLVNDSELLEKAGNFARGVSREPMAQ